MGLKFKEVDDVDDVDDREVDDCVVDKDVTDAVEVVLMENVLIIAKLVDKVDVALVVVAR